MLFTARSSDSTAAGAALPTVCEAGIRGTDETTAVRAGAIWTDTNTDDVTITDWPAGWVF